MHLSPMHLENGQYIKKGANSPCKQDKNDRTQRNMQTSNSHNSKVHQMDKYNVKRLHDT